MNMVLKNFNATNYSFGFTSVKHTSGDRVVCTGKTHFTASLLQFENEQFQSSAFALWLGCRNSASSTRMISTTIINVDRALISGEIPRLTMA